MIYKLLILLTLVVSSISLQAQQVDFKDIKTNTAVEWAATLTHLIHPSDAHIIRQEDLNFEATDQLKNIAWLKKQQVYATRKLQKTLSPKEISQVLKIENIEDYSIWVYQFFYWNEQDQKLEIKPIALGLCKTLTKESNDIETLFWVKLNPNNYTFDHKNQDISWIERQESKVLLKDLDSYKSHKDSLYLQKKFLNIIQKSPYPIYSDIKSNTPLTVAQRNDIIYSSEINLTFDPETFEETATHYTDTLIPQNITKLNYTQDLAWDKAKEEFYLRTIITSLSKPEVDGDYGIFRPLYFQKDTTWLNSLKEFRDIASYIKIDLFNHKKISDNQTKNFNGQKILKTSQNWIITEQLSDANWLCSPKIKVYAATDPKFKNALAPKDIRLLLASTQAKDIQHVLLKQNIVSDVKNHFYRVIPKALGILNAKDKVLFWIKLPDYTQTPELKNPDVLWSSQYYSNESSISYLGHRNDYYVSSQILESFKQRKLVSYPNWYLEAPIDKETRDNMINSLDTIITFDPETFEEIVQIVQVTINPEDGGPLSFIHQFVWDKSSQQLYVNPIRFAPSINESYRSYIDDFQQPFFLHLAGRNVSWRLEYLDTTLTFHNHFPETKLTDFGNMDSLLLDFPSTTQLNIDSKWLKKTILFADAQLTKKLSKKEAKSLLLRTKNIHQIKTQFQIELDQYEAPFQARVNPVSIGVRIPTEDVPIFWLKANNKPQKNAQIHPLGQDFALAPIDKKLTITRLFTKNIIDYVYTHDYTIYSHWNDQSPSTKAHIDTMHHGLELRFTFDSDTFEELISLQKFRPTIKDCTDLLIWWKWDWDTKNHELICTPQGISPIFLEVESRLFDRDSNPLRKFCLYYILYNQE